MTDAATSDAAGTGPTLLRRAAPTGDGPVHRITPADAGWTWIGFRVERLAPGEGFERPGDDQELGVVIAEGAATVAAGTRSFASVGSRASVFEGPPAPVVLVAPGDTLRVRAEQATTVLVASARASAPVPTRLIEPAAIRVEERGHGQTARRVHHLLPPDAPASRLILVEVYTPGGNWSSYPPHKHDVEDPPREAQLEELYYYRFARPQGFAFARVYTADRSLDQAMCPMDGDVVLVPQGYHPVGMPAGYDGYYLNVMAGPSRLWRFTNDPDHAWLMDWSPASVGGST